jgi:hypothetical protein
VVLRRRGGDADPRGRGEHAHPAVAVGPLTIGIELGEG